MMEWHKEAMRSLLERLTDEAEEQDNKGGHQYKPIIVSAPEVWMLVAAFEELITLKETDK